MVAVLMVAACILAWPQAAEACSYDPCYYSKRWNGVVLRTTSPVPRDGAFTFLSGAGSPSCLEDLAPNVSIRVTLAGVPVPGALVQLAGLDQLLIWRPDELLAPDAKYELEVAVDNEGLPVDESFEGPCAPSLVVDRFTLTTSSELSEVPPLAPPTASIETYTVDQDFRGVACCPGVVPQYGDPGGCYVSVFWEYSGAPNDCAYLYERTSLRYAAAAHAVAPAVGDQFVYQLVIDGEVVARSLAAPGLDVLHDTTACAHVEALHLGTGALVASSERCPSAEQAAIIGPHPLDLAGAFGCAEPQVCGEDDGWGEACVPLDPQNPPPLSPPGPSPLEFGCPAAEVALDSSGDTEGPEIPEQGCKCTGGGLDGSVLGLALGFLVRRRRGRRAL